MVGLLKNGGDGGAPAGIRSRTIRSSARFVVMLKSWWFWCGSRQMRYRSDPSDMAETKRTVSIQQPERRRPSGGDNLDTGVTKVAGLETPGSETIEDGLRPAE